MKDLHDLTDREAGAARRADPGADHQGRAHREAGAERGQGHEAPSRQSPGCAPGVRGTLSPLSSCQSQILAVSALCVPDSLDIGSEGGPLRAVHLSRHDST